MTSLASKCRHMPRHASASYGLPPFLRVTAGSFTQLLAIAHCCKCHTRSGNAGIFSTSQKVLVGYSFLGTRWYRASCHLDLPVAALDPCVRLGKTGSPTEMLAKARTSTNIAPESVRLLASSAKSRIGYIHRQEKVANHIQPRHASDPT